MTFLDGKCLLLILKSLILNQHFYDFEIYDSPSTEIPDNSLIGGNAKKLLVVVKRSDFSEENKAFLSKVLSAVKFDINSDCRVLILPEKGDYGIGNLLNTEQCTSILLFGINPKHIGLSIETFLYAPFKIASFSFLLGQSLEKIKNSTENKKSLWSALQKLFLNSE